MSSRKRDQSDIWKHFDKLPNNESKARCRYCACELSRGGKNASIKGFTTTALWTHVKRFHAKELADSLNTVNETSIEVEVTPAKKQTSLKEMWEKRTTYESDDPRSIKITYLVAEQVCLDMEPLDLVNKTGYRRLLSELAPRYNIISRTHLTEKVLPDINERVKLKLKEQLKNIPYLSVTADMWTSDDSSQDQYFISLTGHGVNEEFQLKSYCLEVCPFEGDSHSGENIVHNMHMMFLEWQLLDKVAAVVTDNARNMVKAIEELNLCIQNLKHISCLVHSIQLELKKSLFSQERIAEMLTTCRGVITHFNHSTSALKQLQYSQQANNIPEHVLFQDVDTRWDSTYQMLKRLHEQRIAIQDVLPSLPNCRHEITARQWALISQIIDILANFEEATKELSKESTTLSQAIPIIRSLNSCLNKISNNPSSHPDVKNLTNSLFSGLSNRFEFMESDETYLLATILDPRFKTRIFSTPVVAETAQSVLNAAVYDRVFVRPTRPLEEPQPSASRGIWQACQEIIEEAEMEEPISIFSGDSHIKNEIDAYLRLPNLLPSADPLVFWRDNTQFPRLKKLAQKYFSYKPCTVASERLFSTAGNIQTEKRNRLSPANLQMLCFLNKNLPVVNFKY